VRCPWLTQLDNCWTFISRVTGYLFETFLRHCLMMDAWCCCHGAMRLKNSW
jgi:hypothetical protein